MITNTEIINSKTEVYMNKIFSLADEYIQSQLSGDSEKVAEYFRDMIFFISDRLDRLDNEDIDTLDAMFDAYTRLCTRYHKLPTLECFSWLVKINRVTFTDWSNGEYRNNIYYTMGGERINNINTWRLNHKGQEYRTVPSTTYSNTVKKWLSICKGFVVDELSNSKFANPNLIFTAKAAYGMRETAPVSVEESTIKRVLTIDELPRLGELNDAEEEGITELPKLGE